MGPSNPSDFDPESIKGVTTSRDYKHAHPELIKRFIRLATAFSERNEGKSLLVTCTYRSPEEQQRLYARGRNGNAGPIVTNIDGRTRKSQHNFFPARAVDCAVLVNGKVSWEELHYWPLVHLGREFDLVSGGSWEKWQDWPHLELPKEVV